ncbi:hypothetical protein [Actibacterium ureilyticum]|uniref:hypothetical protein n=1 Tax=Actibacterium ureilyticum TaxID=1590614 RepID=UPI001140A5F4|nr:hypothetical protein [Actibacterium ureilyticum]
MSFDPFRHFGRTLIVGFTFISVAGLPAKAAPVRKAAPKVVFEPALLPVHCHDEDDRDRQRRSPAPAPEPEPESGPITDPDLILQNGDVSGPVVVDFDGNANAMVERQPFRGSAVRFLHQVDCHTSSSKLDKRVTEQVLKRHADTGRHCPAVPDPYLIDCIAAHYEEIAKSLPRTGEAGKARKAFATAASKLRSVVRQTRDETLEPKRYAVNSASGTTRSPRMLQPVAPSRQRAAIAAAVNIVTELQTTLLRSVDSSAQRHLHFQQIASAIDSDKVLLRS